MKTSWRISQCWSALAFAGVLVLAACGGGTESTSAASDLTPASGTTPASAVTPASSATPTSEASTPAATPPTWGKLTESLGDTSLANTVPIQIGAGMYNDPQSNRILTSVTLCYPGTAYCKTIDNIVVDTNSTGLKIFNYAVADEPQGSLPPVKTSFGSIMGQCDTLSDGYVWGQLAYADVKIGGEFAGNQSVLFVDGDASGTASAGIDDKFMAPPGACSSGATRKVRDSNGILGLRTQVLDCQGVCNNTYDAPGPSKYYRCGGGFDATGPGCFPIVEMPPMQSLSPVAAFSTDNNGYILDLLAYGGDSQQPVQANLIFGIDTQSNNQIPPKLSRYSTDDNGQFYNVHNSSNAHSKAWFDSRLPYSEFKDSHFTQQTGLVYTPPTDSNLIMWFLGANADGSESSTGPKINEWHNTIFHNPTSQLAAKYAVVSGYGQAPVDASAGDKGPVVYGLPAFLGRKVFFGISTPLQPTLTPFVAPQDCAACTAPTPPE